MNKVPALSELLVHQAPMILIDDLVDAGKEHIVCRVTIRKSGLFFDLESRTVPGYVGIEFMAQTVAGWAGYQAWRVGEKPAIGFLLGCRSYQCEKAAFDEGTVLDIHAELIMKSDTMAAFRCSIQHKGERWATCELNVYEPPKNVQTELNRNTEG